VISDTNGPVEAMTSQMWLENLAAYSLQVVILIAAGTALVYIFRIRAPNVLLAFWQALLTVCLLLPLFQPWRSVPRATPSAAAPTVEESRVSLPVVIAPVVVTPARLRQTPIPAYPTIAAILGAGIALRLLWLASGLLRLNHYRNKSRLLSTLPESVRDMQWRVGVSPGIFLSEEIDTPVTFGLQQPIVLFPVAFTEMDENLQRPIACHELLHVQRRDWLHIVLEEILRSLFWFHPAVWWALARIHLSREQVVDREVLKVTGKRDPYLESLLHIASLRGRPAAVPAPLLLKERHLVQRVALMLKESTMTKSRLIFSLVAMIALLIWTGTFAAGLFPLTAPPGPASHAHSMLGTSAAPPATETSSPNPGAATAVAAKEASGAEQAQQGQPRLLRKVLPTYPELARRARVEATVILDVTINEQGAVSDVRVLQSHPLLDQTCIDAIRQWVYEPTYVNGRAVPVRTTVTVEFKLAGSRSEQATAVVPIGPSTPRGSGEMVVVTAGVPDTVFVAPTTVPRQVSAVASAAAQAPKVEPLRVGGNVQESKLIKRVDPIYPELAQAARIEGVVILEATINEEGAVADVKLLKGHPFLTQAAIDAVKQWLYSPTYLNGVAVPVVATVTVAFGVPNTSTRVTVDENGNLLDTESRLLPLDRFPEGAMLLVRPEVSFAVLRRVLEDLQNRGIQDIQVSSTAYSFKAGRLFYRYIEGWSSPQAQSAGVDPGIQAPQLSIDIDRLAAMAKASGMATTILPLASAGGAVSMLLGYTIFVSETGEIVAVQVSRGPEIPEITTALSQARVISPGRRGSEPVPVAFTVQIPVK